MGFHQHQQKWCALEMSYWGYPSEKNVIYLAGASCKLSFIKYEITLYNIQEVSLLAKVASLRFLGKLIYLSLNVPYMSPTQKFCAHMGCSPMS